MYNSNKFFFMLFLCMIYYLNRNLTNTCFVSCYKSVVDPKFIIVLNLFYRNKPYRRTHEMAEVYLSHKK